VLKGAGIGLLLVLAPLSAAEAAEMATGSGRFTFSGWAGAALPVYYHRPAGLGRNAPILIVMHGNGRDAERYLREWVPVAEKGRFIAVAPHFARTDFPTTRSYNVGNLRTADGKPIPEPLWSFSAIEPLFDEVRRSVGSARRSYYLFGHSAGSQFVHRFLYWKPAARVEIAFPANAGWYTMPDYSIEYPYGLKGSGVPEANLKRALSRKVVVLLGGQDINRDPDLRTTPEAMAQGPHRFARGGKFFYTAKAAAARLKVPFRWSKALVEGAGHQNGAMAPGVLPYIR